MLDFIRKFFRPRPQQKAQGHKELEDFLSYIKSKAYGTNWSESIDQKIVPFEKADYDFQIENLPSLYLLYEKHSINAARTTDKNPGNLRSEIKLKFPRLAQTRFLRIAFLPKPDQEKELSQLLIIPIEKNARDIVGDSQKELFQNFDYQTKKAFEQFEYDQLSRNELQSTIRYEVNNLIKTLSTIVGEKKMVSWIQGSYELLTDNYKFLDTFSFVVSLLPESFLTEQQFSLLSRAQIENVLLDKTEKLELTNNKLRSEIAEKEQVRQELNEQASRLNKVIESAMDAVVLMDAHGNVTFWNNQAQEIFGWSAAEVIGNRLSSFIVPPEKVEAHEKGLKRFLDTGVAKMLNRRIEEVGQTKDGKKVQLELSIVSNDIGENKIFTAFIRDITDRKEYEQNLMNARDKAEHASRSKAEFLSTMSHEIRTPMNGLFGTIELLLAEYPRPDQVESLKLMKHSTDNLLVILNDILDFSKIEDGHVEFDSREFSLEEVCNRIISTYKPAADEKGIKLFLKTDHTESNTHLGDPVRLSQVLNNLISNAIKFTYAGEVELRVEMISNDRLHSIYRFSVIDTGVGIPEASLKTIFERFSQLKNQKETYIKTGTGLGLAIAKNLLRLQGSDLQVTSELQKGSKFTFDLSLERVHNAKPTARPLTHEERDLSGLKILLVEDNKINQIVAAKFLTKWNCEVDYANNGQEAVESVKEKKYDLVLMDLQMPIMNGYEACEAIRRMEDPYYKELPIIALTADVLPEIKLKVQKSQMNDFMPKPFDPEKLFFTITSHLKFFRVSK